MNAYFPTSGSRSRRAQAGAATLAITLLMLAIVTIVVLFATNTAFFESRTANNESRGRLSEQAAEYGVNLGGELVKSQLKTIGVASRDEGDALRKRVRELARGQGKTSTRKRTAAKRSTAKPAAGSPTSGPPTEQA